MYQNKFLRWQEVSCEELDKYYSLDASDNILKFGSRNSSQLVKRACLFVYYKQPGWS